MTDQQVWDQVSALPNRGFDSPDWWLSQPGVPPSGFARQLLRSIEETAAWAAAGCDLDDAEDRARMLTCLASIEASLLPLRVVLQAIARSET